MFIVMVGVPGSGKSHIARMIAESHDCEIVSSDECRKKWYGDEEYQTHNKELFLRIDELVSRLLDDGKNVILDATNISRKSRARFVAKKKNYCRPQMVSKGGALDIVAGRHPVVETVGGQFISNDTYLDNGDNSMMILTGPNMAGKSTYMRQVALITIMAHLGCFVPAKSAVVPITDRVFTRVGASDNLLFDQSTFMVEMSEVALILRAATKDSLIILDEVGRGTSTYDGLGIAWAVVEYICSSLKAKTLFATHYHELSELEGVVEGVKNYKITVKEINGTIMFLRRIMRGSANKSFGIEVASLAGVPAEVTKRAKVILKNLERNDTAKNGLVSVEDLPSEDGVEMCEIERIIADLDVNNLTPVQAMTVLFDLKEKVKK